jgi:polyisoprenoid-binding protein YceI
MSEQHQHEHHDQSHDEHGEHQLISDRLPAGAWTVAAEGSAVNFSTRAILGIVPVSGVFESFSGELHVNADGAADGRLVVETQSLDTGIEKRDEHLRSPDFFHSVEHPHMVFTVDSITPTGDEHLDLSGSLQIREQTIPMAFPVYAVAHGDHLHIEGRAVIDHKQAGLGWAKVGRVGSKVKVQISLTLNRA